MTGLFQKITARIAAVFTLLATSGGASLIGYIQTGAGAILRVIQDRILELPVSGKEFGALGNGIANDTAGLSAAFTAAANKICILPPGVYLFDPAGLTIPSGISIIGYGATLRPIAVPTANCVSATGKTDIYIEGVTFDGNDYVVATNIGLLAFQTSTNVTVKKCKFVKMDRFALVVNGGSNIDIFKNTFDKTTAAATQNQAILVSTSAGAVTECTIESNTLTRSGMDVSMARSKILNNVVKNWKFGAGITTEQDPLCSNLTITGNYCAGGTGTDSNSYNCGGIENWAAFSVVADNICSSNSGAGIDLGGMSCTVTGNICVNNGMTAGGAGITVRYGSAAYNASGSVFTGNRCYDTGGAAGTQTYGIEEQSASLEKVVIDGNNLQGNKTGQVLILSNTSSFRGLKLSYSVVYNPPSIAAGAQALTDIFAPGASMGDVVAVSFTNDLQGMSLHGYVSATNNVKVVLRNNTGAALDLLSGTLVALCEKHKLSA